MANSLDFGARIYDARLGKFLSVEPLLRYSPSQGSYNVASNNVISKIDFNGLFTMTEADQRKYPELAQLLRNLHEFLQHEPRLKEAFMKATNVTEEQFNEIFTWGKGPSVTVAKRTGNSEAYTSEGPSGTVIVLNIKYIERLKEIQSLRLFDHDILNLLFLVMHEAGHVGAEKANTADAILPPFLGIGYQSYLKKDVGFQVQRLFLNIDQYAAEYPYPTDGFWDGYMKNELQGAHPSSLFGIEYKYDYWPWRDREGEDIYPEEDGDNLPGRLEGNA